MVDINECRNISGVCDLHSICTNLPGHYECGACPVGYYGDGYSICERMLLYSFILYTLLILEIALCGDGECDASLNETCVSCPLDCDESTCSNCSMF